MLWVLFPLFAIYIGKLSWAHSYFFFFFFNLKLRPHNIWRVCSFYPIPTTNNNSLLKSKKHKLLYYGFKKKNVKVQNTHSSFADYSKKKIGQQTKVRNIKPQVSPCTNHAKFQNEKQGDTSIYWGFMDALSKISLKQWQSSFQ